LGARPYRAVSLRTYANLAGRPPPEGIMPAPALSDRAPPRRASVNGACFALIPGHDAIAALAPTMDRFGGTPMATNFYRSAAAQLRSNYKVSGPKGRPNDPQELPTGFKSVSCVFFFSQFRSAHQVQPSRPAPTLPKLNDDWFRRTPKISASMDSLARPDETARGPPVPAKDSLVLEHPVVVGNPRARPDHFHRATPAPSQSNRQLTQPLS